MNSTGTILLIGGAATVFVIAGVKLAKISNTADKLTISLDKFNLKAPKLSGFGAIVIPKIIFNAALTIHNPTNDDLDISHPYIQIFYNGSPIGHSKASSETHTITAKQETPINVDVEFNALNVLPSMPDFLKYIANRASGNKSTRTIRLDILVNTNGIENTVTKEVAI